MSGFSRRDFLFRSGAVALAGLLPGGALLPTAAGAAEPVDPLAPKPTHFPARAKSVIWLHMDGAPSTLDLFDYKPELQKRAGQRCPRSS